MATEATASGAATPAPAPVSDTLALTQNLLRRRSVTPDDQGCQALIAERLQARFHAPVTVCDINAAMLSEGRDRLFDKGRGAGFTYVCGNAESLPFPDASADVYTIAFGIRNVTDIQQALHEAYRVLAPGGQFLCLEFSPSVSPALKPVYDAYSFHLLPRFGEWIARDRDSYQYLAESIRKFPAPMVFARMMETAGFSRIKATALSGGICYIHEGWRL